MIIAGLMLLFAIGLMAQKTTENLRIFDISPNPMEKHCNITLGFDNETYITLVIMNSEEEVIKTIYSGTVYKDMNFTWERDDAAGRYAPSGTYHVVVNYQSRYTSTKKTLILK
jgi:flagellar hook assembly protein FlgD